MIVPPALIDIGTDADAGFWLAALPFVSFPVSDFEPADDARRRLPSGDGPAAPVCLSPFHDHPDSPEEGQVHVG